MILDLISPGVKESPTPKILTTKPAPTCRGHRDIKKNFQVYLQNLCARLMRVNLRGCVVKFERRKATAGGLLYFFLAREKKMGVPGFEPGTKGL